MIRESFHVHTKYCDGKNTPDEIAEQAVKIGFTHLGFSGHAFIDNVGSGLSDAYWMNRQNTTEYISDVNKLKDKFSDKLQIFCGVEQDFFSVKDMVEFDYKIGSVHYVLKDGNYLAVDENVKRFKENVDFYFKGDFYGYAKAYYDLVGEIFERTSCDIIGHFDLISKFFEMLDIKEDDKYLYIAENAVDALVKCQKPFEINTGAIARGHRTTPYPARAILEMIKNKGGKIIFNSDCHNKYFLDCGYSMAEQLAKNVGFTKRSILTKNGFCELDFD